MWLKREGHLNYKQCRTSGEQSGGQKEKPSKGNLYHRGISRSPSNKATEGFCVARQSWTCILEYCQKSSPVSLIQRAAMEGEQDVGSAKHPECPKKAEVSTGSRSACFLEKSLLPHYVYQQYLADFLNGRILLLRKLQDYNNYGYIWQ